MTRTANHADSPRDVGKQPNCGPNDRQSVGAQSARPALRHLCRTVGAVALSFAILALLRWLATTGPAQPAAAQQAPTPTPVPDVSDGSTAAPPGDTQPTSPSALNELALPDAGPEAVAGGETHCTAFPAAQYKNYGTVQSMTNRYYSISISQVSRVYMTVTNATGQIQFRTPRAGNCPGGTTTLIDYQPTAGGSATLRYFTVTPGTYYIRIATTTPGANQFSLRWSATPGWGFSEPNNTACAPRVINLNTRYEPLPENSRPDLNQGSGVGAENDFYRFTLGSQSLVQVQFGTYIAGERQVQLRRGPCGSTTMVDSAAYIANAPSGTIQRTLPAGNYWVRFITLNGTQSRVKYSLSVSVGAAAGWAPRMNTCWPFPGDDSNCGAGRYSNGQVNVYWHGAPQATTVQAIFRGIGSGNCPRPPDRTETFAPSSTPQGSRAIIGLVRGYYGLTLKISGPLGTYTRNEMPVKMDCEFLLASPSEWPGLAPQQPTNQGGSVSAPPLTPMPTPIPEVGDSVAPSPVVVPGQQPTPVP